ncbi:MAG: Fe-S cluster assembly ATPase SufC [Oscillospiraceae bacterium]|nr:Fe-S cluster assembly ATPase SufC [Oscillospiraceae bacterium]
MDKLLEVKNLHVKVDEKELLHGVDLTIDKGETHVLLGPNGAGKSTLGLALMGHPRYTVTEGEILFKGEHIEEESADKRAKAGLFLSFQSPIDIPGITVSSFLRNALEQRTGKRVKLWDFKKQLNAAMDLLQIERTYAERELNVGFSGGERKKMEILQLYMLDPDLAILDETDSGLDIDAVRIVSSGVSEFLKQGDKSLLIITHSTKLLESLHVDQTHVLVNGNIVETSDRSLVDKINLEGYAAYGSQE